MRLPTLSLLSAFSTAAFQEQTVLAPGQALAQVYNSGGQTDILHIYQMAVDPNPVEKGSNFTFFLGGHLSNNVTQGAYIDMTISVGLLRQPTQRIDLCDKANGYVKLDCPIDKGLVEWTTEEIFLPDRLRNARYRIQVVGKTVEDEHLFRLEAIVDFRSG